MNVKEWAEKLNGREIGSEISDSECVLAKKDNIVVAYGASDDLLEFEGAIRDEYGVLDGGTVYINKGGVLAYHDEYCECSYCNYEEVKSNAKEIHAVWCPQDEKGNIVSFWEIKSEIPHETFKIIEDGELYCIGIVFSMDDVK